MRHFRIGWSGSHIWTGPVQLNAKWARPDDLRPGAPFQIASLHLGHLERQTLRTYGTQDIIFTDVQHLYFQI